MKLKFYVPKEQWDHPGLLGTCLIAWVAHLHKDSEIWTKHIRKKKCQWASLCKISNAKGVLKILACINVCGSNHTFGIGQAQHWFSRNPPSESDILLSDSQIGVV